MRRPRTKALALAILAGALPFARSRADVPEVGRIAQAVSGAGPGTLVVLDVDNTLIEAVQTLGSDQWYDHLVEVLVKERGLPRSRAEDEAIAVWNAVQDDTQVRAVDPEAAAVVRRLQGEGAAVMALTARMGEIAAVTRKQLASVGIDLAARPVHGSVLVIPLASPATYTGGVLYVGEQNEKGPVLAAFLGRIGLRPKRVVFVDDKAKHVRSVAEALRHAGARVDGYRFTGSDARVRSFDPSVADIQYRFWKKILSDEEARKLLGKQ